MADNRKNSNKITYHVVTDDSLTHTDKRHIKEEVRGKPDVEIPKDICLSTEVVSCYSQLKTLFADIKNPDMGEGGESSKVEQVLVEDNDRSTKGEESTKEMDATKIILDVSDAPANIAGLVILQPLFGFDIIFHGANLPKIPCYLIKNDLDYELIGKIRQLDFFYAAILSYNLRPKPDKKLNLGVEIHTVQTALGRLENVNMIAKIDREELIRQNKKPKDGRGYANTQYYVVTDKGKAAWEFTSKLKNINKKLTEGCEDELS